MNPLLRERIFTEIFETCFKSDMGDEDPFIGMNIERCYQLVDRIMLLIEKQEQDERSLQ